LDFALEVVALLVPEFHYTFSANALSIAVFSAVALATGVLLFANIFLWVRMLHFFFRYDAAPFAFKLIWSFVLIFGLSIGAAIYYWFVYRNRIISTLPVSTGLKLST
jgi:hypothetical protein